MSSSSDVSTSCVTRIRSSFSRMLRTFEYERIALTRKKPIPATRPTIDHQEFVSRNFRLEAASCKSLKSFSRAKDITADDNSKQPLPQSLMACSVSLHLFDERRDCIEPLDAEP